MKKKLLAIILSLCLCISMIPLGAMTALAETITDLPKSMHKIHEAVYYDKNPDPSMISSTRATAKRPRCFQRSL